MSCSTPTVPVLSVLLALSVLSCGGDPSGPGPITELPRSLSEQETVVIEAANGFAIDLLRVATAGEDGPNVFLSPLSASMALAMAMNGADGETWTQMRDVLGWEGLEEPEINRAYSDLIALLLDLDPAVEVGLGNSVWARQGVPFHQSFLERVEEAFDAEIATLDFTRPDAKDVINGWVAEVTEGRIDDLIDQIPPEAIMYLINAIYFNGEWRYRFDEADTRQAPFRLADGTTVQVPMMQGEVGARLLHTPEGARGVELPYGGDAFTAVAILPPADQTVAELVAELNAATWEEWMDELDRVAEVEDTEQEARLVRFPKIELEYKRLLNDDLEALGMSHAFSEPLADFTRLTPLDSPAGEGPPWVYLSRVLQNTFLKVDERGTEAAAATAVEIGVVSAPQPLVFDRPFLFAIRERLTGSILFIGVIGDPRG